VPKIFKVNFLILITITLHEDLCTFMISPSFLPGKRNISDVFVQKIKTHILCSVMFVSKIVPFMR